MRNKWRNSTAIYYCNIARKSSRSSNPDYCHTHARSLMCLCNFPHPRRRRLPMRNNMIERVDVGGAAAVRIDSYT